MITPAVQERIDWLGQHCELMTVALEGGQIKYEFFFDLDSEDERAFQTRVRAFQDRRLDP